ncbi:MAG: cellulose biosynthesis cyclic di-GMP-binding regulatory protein BcsB [Chromatiales bacterium]|nr:cellulose biosynthesis cyclic di-GMP-binding regulatory protein BcsB [Gammaproteobacteria bacterium]MBW6477454.1 cellulose biosynthesis cyclic di-GMP-binding regulatory protein BcsB [Chromatiales bacterium]
MPNTPPTLRRPLVGVLILLALLISPLADAGFVDKSSRLSEFTPHSGPIRLHGVAENFDLYIPLADTSEIKDGWLDLSLSRSIALQAERSSFRIMFNETTLAQIPFNPDQPMAHARLRIPDALWRKGFNKLTLSVIQHYVYRYEDPNAPELWTEIDLYNSSLSYKLAAADQGLRLQDLGGIFSPGIGGQATVLMLSSAAADFSSADAHLPTSLPLLAQALALHRNYAPLNIQHAAWQANTADDRTAFEAGAYHAEAADTAHLLIGTRAELSSVLPNGLLERIQGPFLQLAYTKPPKASAEQPQQVPAARLIVSGNTPEEVIQAAQMLLDTTEGHSTPALPGHFLQPQGRYSFAELGRNTVTLGGAGNKRVGVKLPISGEFHTHESAQAELLLDFAYGAGVGMGSVMSVFLNGEFVHGLKLGQEHGAAFRNYRIELPARKLLPGINTLDFDFTMRPETFPGEYPTMPGSHLLVQILDSSSIRMPKASPLAVLPDLASFSATGFPYIAQSNHAAARLVVTDQALMGAALSLSGKLAQQAQRANTELRVLDQLANPGGNMILLSTPAAMPEELFSEWSAALQRSKRWSLRALNQIRTEGLLSLANASESGIIHEQGLDKQAVMLAMRYPGQMDTHTLTILSADSHALLTQRVQSLLQPQLWNQLHGDLVSWEGLGKPLLGMRVNNFYEVGEQARWDRIMLSLSNNPWYWILALLLSAVLMALLARRYLRRHEAAKLAE